MVVTGDGLVALIISVTETGTVQGYYSGLRGRLLYCLPIPLNDQPKRWKYPYALNASSR